MYGQLAVVKDISYRYHKDTSNITVMIGLYVVSSMFLQNFDFSAGGYAITGYRDEVIDFSEPYANAVNIVMIKKPSGTSKVLLYLKPLRYEVNHHLWCGSSFVNNTHMSYHLKIAFHLTVLLG